MFVSSGQFYVFLSCVSFGVIGGLVFYLMDFIKILFRKNMVKSFIDFLSMIIVSIFYVFYSNMFNFPNIRLYMPLGVLLGLIMYFKSFNIILAKLQKKIYNKNINHKGNKTNGRAKVQKSA